MLDLEVVIANYCGAFDFVLRRHKALTTSLSCHVPSHLLCHEITCKVVHCSF